jgi:hypothetical protein
MRVRSVCGCEVDDASAKRCTGEMWLAKKSRRGVVVVFAVDGSQANSRALLARAVRFGLPTPKLASSLPADGSS